MSNYLDLLENELRAAVTREMTQSRRRRPQPSVSAGRRLRSLRTGIGAVAVAAAAAVAVGVVVVALLTLEHRHAGPPSLGTAAAHQQQELNYIRAANQKAFRSSACREPTATGPIVSDGSPAPALLSALSVLRRPATGADRVPRSFLNNLDASGIYVHYIRLARVADGTAYYIVPAATLFPNARITARCDVAITAAFHAELPRIPSALRAATLSLEARLTAQRRQRLRPVAGGGICLLTYQTRGNANGGLCGATLSVLRQQGLMGPLQPLAGVVPDGVATVTFHYPRTTTFPARTITTNVVENVFLIPPQPRDRVRLPATITWRSARGTIVRQFAGTFGQQQPSSGVCTAKPASSAC